MFKLFITKKILDKSPKKNGELPIALRVNFNGNYKTIRSSFAIPAQFYNNRNKWIKKSYPELEYINDYLNLMEVELRQSILKMYYENKRVAPLEIFHYIKQNLKGKKDISLLSPKNNVTHLLLLLQEYKTFKNIKFSTYLKYKGIVKNFIEISKKSNINTIEKKDIDGFVESLYAKDNVKSTVIRKHTILKSLFEFAKKKGWSDVQDTEQLFFVNFNRFTASSKKRYPLGLQEFYKILEAPVSKNKRVHLDAFALMFYLGGCRIGDIIFLKNNCIDLEKRAVNVYLFKGSVFNKVELSSPAWKIIKKYHHQYGDFLMPYVVKLECLPLLLQKK